MAKSKKGKRREVKIVEPLAKFSKEMKTNFEIMLKNVHDKIDNQLKAMEKYFEKSKGKKSGSMSRIKKAAESLKPAKVKKKGAQQLKKVSGGAKKTVRKIKQANIKKKGEQQLKKLGQRVKKAAAALKPAKVKKKSTQQLKKVSRRIKETVHNLKPRKATKSHKQVKRKAKQHR